MNLTGYTSTSKLLYSALYFANFGNNEDQQIPVVFEIMFKKNTGFFEMTEEFTAYPEEGEVLLQDGLEYSVLSNQDCVDSDTNKIFRKIQLVFPA